MSIDVVRTILRVVFNHEYRRLGPISTIGNGLNNLSKREVVVRNHCGWRTFADTRSACVVVSNSKNNKLRQVIVSIELGKFLSESLRPIHIWKIQVVRAIERIKVILQGLDSGFSGNSRCASVLNKFPKAKVTYACLCAFVPNVTARRSCDFVSPLRRVSNLAFPTAIA